MKSVLWCAVVAALIVPSATQAQSIPQRGELATKLLAIIQKNALPNSGTYSVIGTALHDGQTKVYIQQEMETKKSHVNYEYLCMPLDVEAGWMCAGQAPAPSRLIHVK